MIEHVLRSLRRHPRRVALGVFAGCLSLWLAPMLIAAFRGIDVSGLERPYLVIGAFVVFDALIPVFPSESLLTAASTLISGGQTDMRLVPLIVTGAVAAIVGDSALFLTARTVGRRTVSTRLATLEQGERIGAAMRVLGARSATLIVGGRFVPGLRFVVNATMGVSPIPYRRFLLWSAVGGTMWSTYTCLITYLVGQALGEYPLVSFLTATVISGLLIRIVAQPVRREYAAERARESSNA